MHRDVTHTSVSEPKHYDTHLMAATRNPPEAQGGNSRHTMNVSDNATREVDSDDDDRREVLTEALANTKPPTMEIRRHETRQNDALPASHTPGSKEQLFAQLASQLAQCEL